MLRDEVMENVKEEFKNINSRVRRLSRSPIGCPEGDYMETKREVLFEKIMAKNIPELIKRHLYLKLKSPTIPKNDTF